MQCERCGLYYDDMLTGLTYGEVFEMLWEPSHDPSRWRYKRRHTVLGKWHQIKLELWEYHLETCEGESV